jgi:hypothetical protein
MLDKYICGSKKYTIGNGTIALPVIFNALPKSLMINDCLMYLVGSFHISLVCLNEIIKKNKVSTYDFKNLVINDFCEYTKNNDVSSTNNYGEFRIVSEVNRKSLILMVEVTGLNDFFKIINDKYNLRIESQPTHVTLYASQPDSGIFITNSDDINSKTLVIDNPLAGQEILL